MATYNSNLPPIETQTSYLFGEMGSGDGGNISNTFYNNPNMSASDAAIAFENQFERSGGSNISGRVNNANNVYDAYTSGNLSSLPANAQYVFNQAIAQGYTPAQAAGIVGNLQAESGQNIDPTIVNEIGASGIAQWLGGRLDNLQAYDPATGEIVPNTEVQAGDINAATGKPLTAEEAKAARDSANKARQFNRTSNWKSNELNAFASYTYNWAIHIFHPNFAGKDVGELINSKSLITLSQTGVENEISIDTVTQTMALAFEKDNRRSFANNFTINFVEPGGATFYTRIFEAAKRLGIENHLESCYVLELNLIGWDDSSTVSTTIGPFYYQTIMMSLEMQFRDGASFYTGEFVETAEDAFSKNEFHLTSAITGLSASTLGDFLKKFETEVNKQKQNEANSSLQRIYPDTYHFGFNSHYSDWAKWGFSQVSSSNLENNRGVDVSLSGGTLTINAPAGTAITSVISMAVLNTTEFQKLPSSKGGFAKDSPDAGTANADKLAEIVNWLSYDTDVKYGRFDPLYKRYVKDITYNLKGFPTPEILHDPVSYQTLLGKDYQMTRLDNMFNDGYLRKRYDYINTGLNTEVLDTDITFNMAYFNVQALNQGYVNASALLAGNANSAEQEVVRLKNVKQQLDQKIRESDNRIASLQAEQTRLTNEMINSTESGRLASQYNAVTQSLASEQNQRKIAYSQLPSATENINAASTIARNSTSAPITSLPSNINRYITQDELIPSGMTFDKYMPNKFQQVEIQSLATANSPEAKNNVGQAMIGAVEVNLGKAYDLMEQTLTIRGDPYWLGMPKGADAISDTRANYELGGIMYFFNAEFPTYPEEGSGLPSNRRNFMVSGVYRVFSCEALYQNGLFTMKLQSSRDMNMESEIGYESLMAGYALELPSRSGPGHTNRDRQNQTNNNPNTNNRSATGSDGTAGTGAVGNNTTGQNNLATNVNPDLNTILTQAAAASGVAVDNVSGLRTNEIGSGRHYEGDASDVQLSVNGRVLSANNPADREIIQTFTQNYVAIARDFGYTPSVGWADTSAPQSEWYMGGNTGHYDIAIGHSSHLSSGASNYWGNGESSTGAPTWLKNVMTG
jgi:hypothetical protein